MTMAVVDVDGRVEDDMVGAIGRDEPPQALDARCRVPFAGFAVALSCHRSPGDGELTSPRVFVAFAPRFRPVPDAVFGAIYAGCSVTLRAGGAYAGITAFVSHFRRPEESVQACLGVACRTEAVGSTCDSWRNPIVGTVTFR